jgi:hypothetical protein
MAICSHWLRKNSMYLLPSIEKLATQQDLTKFKIAVALLHARTNRLEHIRPLAAELLEKLPGASAGALTIIGT